MLTLGLTANLGLPGYFKYSVYILENLFALTDLHDLARHISDDHLEKARDFYAEEGQKR